MSVFNDGRNTPTRDQKNALRGTRGRPSLANRYVTEADRRLTNTRTPSAHRDTHEAGGSDPVYFHALVPRGISPEMEFGLDSPAVDGWWVEADGGSPETFYLKIRRYGIVYSVPLMEVLTSPL
jgi:hypothetical protein